MKQGVVLGIQDGLFKVSAFRLPHASLHAPHASFHAAPHAAPRSTSSSSSGRPILPAASAVIRGMTARDINQRLFGQEDLTAPVG